MQRFVARLNIEHYREILAFERDPERQRLVSGLLADEESKLAAIERQSARAPDDDVSRLNLTYYRKRLASETDLVIRQILIRMIAEEEAKGSRAPERKNCGGD